MDSEESFLETLARYSFPIPLLTGTKGRRSATSSKKETQDRLKNANTALKSENGRLENELRTIKSKMGKDSNIEAKYNALLEVIKKLNPKLNIDKEIEDEINAYQSKVEQIQRLTAECDNLNEKIKHIEANRIDPDQLISLVEPLTEAMKGSFDTFTEFGTKLRLGDANSDKQAKAAEKTKSDFLTHFTIVEEASKGSAKNEASMALLTDMIRFTNEIEQIKKDIIANFPDFQDLDEEIRKVTEVFTSSEQTLRIMVDLFGADKENYRKFETTCNDRVKVSANLTKIVSMPNFTHQFASLKAELARTENLLNQHEDIKRAMLANRQGAPDLEQLVADVDKNLGLTDEVIEKFEGNVEDKKFNNELKAARAQRDKVNATNMSKARSTADKNALHVEKLKGLLNLQNKFLVLKSQAVEIAKPEPAQAVEGEIIEETIPAPTMGKKQQRSKLQAGRRPEPAAQEVVEETKGQTQDPTDWPAIHDTLNTNLENAENALSACQFSSGDTNKKAQDALDKLLNSSQGIRKYGNTPKNPYESLQEKEKIMTQILGKISHIANSAAKESEKKGKGLAAQLAQATAAREASENKASELVTKLEEATNEKAENESKANKFMAQLAEASSASEESEKKNSELVAQLKAATKEKEQLEKKQSGFAEKLAKATAAQEASEKKAGGLITELAEATKAKEELEKKSSGFAEKLAKATAAQEACEKKAGGLLSQLAEATAAKEEEEKKAGGLMSQLKEATAAKEEEEKKSSGFAANLAKAGLSAKEDTGESSLMSQLAQATKAREKIEKKSNRLASKLAKASAAREESDKKTNDLMGQLAAATKAQEKIEKKSNRFASKLAKATAARDESKQKTSDLLGQLAEATKAKEEAEGKANTFMSQLAEATGSKTKKGPGLIGSLAKDISGPGESEAKVKELEEQLASAAKESQDLSAQLASSQGELASSQRKSDRKIQDLEDTLIGTAAKNKELQDKLDSSRGESEGKGKELEEKLAASVKEAKEMQEKLDACTNERSELEQHVNEAVEQQDQLMEEKENLSEQCDEQTSKIAEMEKAAAAMKEELDQVSSGATDFEKALDEKDQTIDDLQDQVDVLEYKEKENQKFKHMYEGREGELTSLRAEKDQGEYELAELKGQLKIVIHERGQAQMKCRQLEAFQRKAMEHEREAQKLKQRIKNFEELENEKLGDHQQLIDSLNADLQKCCEEKAALEAKIKEMEEEASTDKEDRNQANLRRCVNKMLGLRRFWQQEAYLIWKLYEKPKLDIVDLDTPPIDFDDVEVEASDLEEAQNVINRQKNNILERNPVIVLYDTSGSKNEKPMPYVNVFRFFEDLMDKKFALDNTALAANQRPQEISSFMLEHLNKMFGLKKLAIRQLSQIMPSLRNLVNERNEYGSIYARILQVFHPSPLPFNLTLYLVRMRMEFGKLIDQGLETRGMKPAATTGRSSRRTSTAIGRTAATAGAGRQAYELAAVGGEAMLNDTLDLIMTTFESDPQSAELMMKLVCPVGVSDVEFIIFKICHKMAKLGLDAEKVFNMIDENGDGTLDRGEFGKKAKELCHLPISVEDITKVFDHIDTDRNGSVVMEEFKDFVSIHHYEINSKSPTYLVTKSSFMNALVTTYCALQRRDAAFAFAYWNDETGGKNATKEQAIALAQKKDDDMPESIKNQLISDWDGMDTITADDFVLAVINRNVGGLGAGAFYIPELANVVESSSA